MKYTMKKDAASLVPLGTHWEVPELPAHFLIVLQLTKS